MKKETKLNSLLEDLASAGQVQSCDSEFSIDLGKLKERYQVFQEGDPAYCFLRLFQGVVRFGAREIRLRLSRNSISMEVQLFETGAGTDELKPAEILEKLNQPKHWTPNLEPVYVGLLSATTESNEVFCYEWNGRALVYRNGEFQLEKSSEFEVLRFSVKKVKRSWLSDTKIEHANLAKRLGFAPFPVDLDSRYLTKNIDKPAPNAWLEKFGAPFYLAHQADKPKDSQFYIDLDEGLRYHPAERLFSWSCPKEGFENGFLLVAAALSDGGRLYPVIDGVLGRPLSIDHCLGLVGYVHFSDEKTDLSGLALHNPEEQIARVTEGYQLLLEKILPHIEHAELVWPDPLSVTKKATLLASTSLEGFLLIPVLLGMAAVESGVKIGVRTLTKASKTKAFRRELKERIEHALRFVKR